MLVPAYCLAMRYYITSQLSEHIAQTPEGFLLCRDVAIARTGTQEYLPEEVPANMSASGSDVVRIFRLADDVFDPQTLASYEGKPITIDHPQEFVTPANWRELAVGHAQNVRRGEGEFGDLVLADLLITDQEAISLVRGGLRELSCGYDADYEALAPGVGRQINIKGNHIALVEAGRCGERCKIKDTDMSNPKKKSLLDRIIGNPKAKKSLDEALEAAGQDNEPDQPEQQQQATDNDQKLDEILLTLRSLLELLSAKGADQDPGAAQDEDPDKDPDKPEDSDPDDPDKPKGQATDSARRKTADADTIRRASLLAPTIRAKVGDSDCTVKRASLRQAVGDKAVSKVVDACLRGTSLDKADCLTLDAAFTAASELVAAKNNSKTADSLAGATHDGQPQMFGQAVTPAQINDLNRKMRDSLSGK